MRAIATVLVLALSACTTEPSSPTPDDVGDGDGDMGDGDASGDGDEQPADLPAAMLDLPPEGLGGCCICTDTDPWCEAETATSEAECQAYAESYADLEGNSPAWEWWTNCEPDASQVSGLRCPGSCAD